MHPCQAGGGRQPHHPGFRRRIDPGPQRSLRTLHQQRREERAHPEGPRSEGADARGVPRTARGRPGAPTTWPRAVRRQSRRRHAHCSPWCRAPPGRRCGRTTGVAGECGQEFPTREGGARAARRPRRRDAQGQGPRRAASAKAPAGKAAGANPGAASPRAAKPAAAKPAAAKAAAPKSRKRKTAPAVAAGPGRPAAPPPIASTARPRTRKVAGAA